MAKPTKIIVIAFLVAAALTALWMVRGLLFGGNSAAGDLVFTNQTDILVGSVGLRWENETQIGCHADGSLFGEGDYLAFTVERYPVTVTLYRDVEAREELISCVIEEPPKGRWYLFLNRNGAGEPELLWAHGGQGPKDLQMAMQKGE